MRDFSIDNSVDKIFSAKTRDYFEEVIKSYYNDSYRSVVVMLYSIAIADLIYKLQDLKEIYNDEKATNILTEINTLQSNNPTSPDWESKLIELIKERTNLLEPADYLNLVALQKHRHLCAHPVMTQNYDLYKPNKETARAHIRNCLEGILTKPPILSRAVFDDFLNDLAAIKGVIFNDIDLKRHITSKYLDRLNFNAEKQIFKSLWKMTFKVDNATCEENRTINLKAIKVFIERNYREYLDLMKSEIDYYSAFNEKFLLSIIGLLNNYPDIYQSLNESAKVLIKSKIERDLDLATYAWFLTGDIRKHITKTLRRRSKIFSEGNKYDNISITTQSILELYETAVQSGFNNDANMFLIEMFGYSMNYDNADTRYDSLIKPYLDSFSKDELKALVKNVNENSQIYDRRNAYSTNWQIKLAVDKASDNDFDYDKYSNFKSSIRQ
ncbi:MAG: hypothetical protein NTY07_19860 [Bacteroidia bacterium]|nr:hypothetical protein [Bacteroidia bacterium]